MTAFVLVSGPFTGGWVWREVTARLRESGAEVHPATLTGLGDRRHLAGPDTDLETHIEDLVQLIDTVDAEQVVLVGHDYGIHPVLGAADRRPERIARIVHLDAGMPQNGDAALALVPDQAVRERLRPQPVGATRPADDRPAEDRPGDDRRVPAPAEDEWRRWGSTAGVPAAALARLTRLAAPQPQGTLTQPLRLSGALSTIPTSGVFCTANGMTIAMVEMLVATGPPQFQALADPRVGFFELATGHWPMLSCPDELAGVLLRAAAGEGHRVTAKKSERPTHLQPFLLDVPDRPRERIGNVDLYLPDDLPGSPGADRPQPAVVLVHGGPISADLRPTPRDWPMYTGYARQLAGLGVVGVTLDHRLHGLADYGLAARDVAAAVELVRADPRVDGERIALWFFSGGGLLTADWLAAPPPWLRCVAANYPVLAPLPGWSAVDSRFRPAAAVHGAGRLPIVLTRVGLEHPEIAATVEEFLAAAKDADAELEVVDVPLGHHGFETLDRTEQSRRAVEHAVGSVLARLRG